MTLIIVGDHGSSFKRGESRRIINPKNMGGIAFTPLFIKYPYEDNTKGVSFKTTRSLDVVPTLLESLGIDHKFSPGRVIQEIPETPIKNIKVGKKIFSFSRVKKDSLEVIKARDYLLGKRDLFEMGANSGLIGEKSLNLYLTNKKAEIHNSGVYKRINNNNRKEASVLKGSTVVKRGTRLAISVNGVIRATAQIYKYNGKNRFMTFIDSSLFNDGKNKIEVFTVSEQGYFTSRIY